MKMKISTVLAMGYLCVAAAQAQTVQLQTFDPSEKQNFVRGAAADTPHKRKAVVIDVQNLRQEDLAKDFAKIGAGNGDSQAVPPAYSMPDRPSIKIPRWMQRHERGQGANNLHFFASPATQLWQGYQTAAVPSGCQADPYRPKHLKVDVEARRARYYSLMVTVACEVGVPVKLFDALLTQESGYNPFAVSPKGAVGMSQLMPDTARAFGVRNSWDIADNLRGGARVLKSHLNEFGRYDLALAAYNAGPNRVRKNGSVPRIKETVAYVSSILSDVRRQFLTSISLASYP